MVLGEKHFNVKKKKRLRDKGEESRIKTKGNHSFAYYISRTTLGYRVHNGQQERSLPSWNVYSNIYYENNIIKIT